MGLDDRLRLPDERAALVIQQDGRSVTAGEIGDMSETLAVELKRLGAGRALLSTDRADQVVTALLACRSAQCDLVLHRGPTTADGLAAALGAGRPEDHPHDVRHHRHSQGRRP